MKKTEKQIALWVFLVCFAFLGTLEAAPVTIRIAAYNTYNNPDDAIEDAWFNTIFSAIGSESVNGVAKRLDILAVSETDTGSSARLADILNNLYGVSTYNVVTSSSVGGDRTGIVYDSNTLILLDSNDITDIGTHPILRVHFRPVGYASTVAEFYVYAIHLKSGSSASDKTQRALEAANLRSNVDALGEDKNIIFAGDFNMQGSSEAAWTNMLASGNGQAFDTADSPGEWQDNETFKSLHSQNPRSPMDDRFDIQFVSGEFLDGKGLEYASGSYHVFGNNGTHTLNDSISTGSGASPTVLTALEDASDHLPIVADYRIPESLCVSFSISDLNGDCVVNFLDFAILGNQWLEPPGIPSADIAPEPPDNFVDGSDLAVLTGDWLDYLPEEMIFITGGDCNMGDHYGVGRADEKPLHAVYVDSFYMGKYEITNQQYCDFLNAAAVKVFMGDVYASSDSTNMYPYFSTYSDTAYSQIAYSEGTFSVRTRDSNSMAEHPVVWVSWYGTVAYCNWRSNEEGYEQCYNLATWQCDFSKQGYRLPTEAEWEYAARGGCHTPYYKYPWCDNTISCTKANFYNFATCNPLGLSSYPHTAPVGYYSANYFGLYDMTGNVSEWCNDWYGSDYYSSSPYDNPTGPGSGDRRIKRSGAWTTSSTYCRTATRSWGYPGGRGYVDGFRIVLDLE